MNWKFWVVAIICRDHWSYIDCKKGLIFNVKDFVSSSSFMNFIYSREREIESTCGISCIFAQGQLNSHSG